jgi:hypothetical protein
MDSIFYGRGHVGVKINDQVGQIFQKKKRVRQEDPLSHIIFNIVVNMLAILTKGPNRRSNPSLGK